MKKIFLALMLGLTSFGISAQASASARLDSMAADSREVDDIDLIWLYPNKVLDYKNTVDLRLASDGDFGDGTNEWGGVISEIDPDLGTWGVYVNRPVLEESSLGGTVLDPLPSLLFFSQQSISLSTSLDVLYENKLDVFWGKNLGGADLGVHFNYGSSLPADFNTGTDIDVLSMSVGLGLANLGPFNHADFHLDYGFENINLDGVKDNGCFTGRAGVLLSSDLDKESALRLFADSNLSQFKIDAEPINISIFTQDLGLSVNRKVNGGKGLISTGLVFEYSSINESIFLETAQGDLWTLLWNASLEYPVFDWLTLRTGMAKALVAREYINFNFLGVEYGDFANDPVVFNLGFGINWQNFTLDANVNAGSLENSINNTQPGHGLFFNNGEPLAQVLSADLKYKF